MPLLESAHKPVHVTIHGTMFGGGEEWQTGFYMGGLTSDATVPTQAFADLVKTQWSTFMSTASNFITGAFVFTGVKCVLLEKDGRYGVSEPVESFPTSGVAGGYGGAAMPPQVALVATLIGGSGKGLGGKGRMYLPGVACPIDGTGHILNTSCQSIADHLASMFNTLDASSDAPGHVINVSRGHKALLGAGNRNVPVNGVRVGNVFDTQRRRRNALSETYYAATVSD